MSTTVIPAEITDTRSVAIASGNTATLTFSNANYSLLMIELLSTSATTGVGWCKADTGTAPAAALESGAVPIHPNAPVKVVRSRPSTETKVSVRAVGGNIEVTVSALGQTTPVS